ncbi:hypothetical protein GCM10011371_26910 [Novosphingobium marinum]|uniref:Phage-related minor tail protein n=1 Tax=Novosphingobium marinum TaxID=1514948 RepID=A0A7Y9XX35_9SPHN|nr:tail tape measure protein [Novosphingobium marinum]NYH94693.1 phage-related minor tail protein [Novosphingobium marinum]GGC38133.1 hypothetical protein GCM10011371_26910 [Novosphingobium marinum]
MDEDVESLLVEVRASTEEFAQDIATMRGSVDGTLADGFARAGDVLERGLTGAIRKGSLGFDDLKRVALNALDEIAAQALHSLIPSGGGGLFGGLFDAGGIIGAALGLPGRATGGAVSPGRGYLVGERGPELFVPASAGRVENFGIGQPGQGGGRDVRISINVNSPRGADVPQSLQRSARQVAAAVRRALA